MYELSYPHAPGCRPLLRSNFLFCGQLARVFLEHYRNVVADRVGKPAWTANQFVLTFAELERAFAYRANQNVDEFSVHERLSISG